MTVVVKVELIDEGKTCGYTVNLYAVNFRGERHIDSITPYHKTTNAVLLFNEQDIVLRLQNKPEPLIKDDEDVGSTR